MGELAWKKGDKQKAQDMWEKAKSNDAHQQVTAARINLAWIAYQQMRQTTDPGQRQKLEDDALHNLQGALAIDNDNVVAYTVMALIFMEGAVSNRNRLDVAQLPID